MLILNRKPGQELFIGKDISITLLDLKADYIRLGINAPKETIILRKELMKRYNIDSIEEAMEFFKNF